MKKRLYCTAVGIVLLGGILSGCGDRRITAENGKVENPSGFSTSETTVTTTKDTTHSEHTTKTDESGVMSDAKDVLDDAKDEVTSIMSKATSEIGTDR